MVLMTKKAGYGYCSPENILASVLEVQGLGVVQQHSIPLYPTIYPPPLPLFSVSPLSNSPHPLSRYTFYPLIFSCPFFSSLTHHVSLYRFFTFQLFPPHVHPLALSLLPLFYPYLSFSHHLALFYASICSTFHPLFHCPSFFLSPSISVPISQSSSSPVSSSLLSFLLSIFSLCSVFFVLSQFL